MVLSKKIKTAIQKLFHTENTMDNWGNFSRTHFNNIALVINKKITKAAINNSDLVAQYLIIGKIKIEKDVLNLNCGSITGFIEHLSKRSEYQIYNWVSGKTLQSYWNNGDAKIVKINALLVFLEVPIMEWNDWIKEIVRSFVKEETSLIFPFKTHDFNHSSFKIIKKYYVGNYYLYYQKTDGSDNIIKTPFILKEQESGEILVHSISEGHQYTGKVMGLRDGCLYINCQNLDFEEIEQYVFNIGLETNPEVLFGVSTTVSVKDRLGVALKNILVKQKLILPDFERESESEISFNKYYTSTSEESTIVNFLKNSSNNIIKTRSCCNLFELVTDQYPAK